MRASGLNAHLERLPEELRDVFTGELAASLEQPIVLHYVRLNLSATRPG